MMDGKNFELPEEFSDLSPKRQRQIAKYVSKERNEAALNAVITGIKTLNQREGYGLKRLIPLFHDWYRDLRNLYTDFDIYKPRLDQWLMDIGIQVKEGSLCVYLDEDDKPVRAAKAIAHNEKVREKEHAETR